MFFYNTYTYYLDKVVFLFANISIFLIIVFLLTELVLRYINWLINHPDWLLVIVIIDVDVPAIIKNIKVIRFVTGICLFWLIYIDCFIIFLFSLRKYIDYILSIDRNELLISLLNFINLSNVTIVLIGLLLFLLLCSLTNIKLVDNLFSKETHDQLLFLRRLLLILNIVSFISIVVYCLSICILLWNDLKKILYKLLYDAHVLLPYHNIVSNTLLICLSLLFLYIVLVVYFVEPFRTRIRHGLEKADQLYKENLIEIRSTMWLFYIGIVLYCVIILILCIFSKYYFYNITITSDEVCLDLNNLLKIKKLLIFICTFSYSILKLILFTLFGAVLLKILTNVAHLLSLGKNTLLILTNTRRCLLLLNTLYLMSFVILNVVFLIFFILHRATIVYGGWTMLILILIVSVCIYIAKKNIFFQKIIYSSEKECYFIITNIFYKVPWYSSNVFRDHIHVLIQRLLLSLLLYNVVIVMTIIYVSVYVDVYGYILYVFWYSMLRIFYILVILFLLDVLKKRNFKNMSDEFKRDRFWHRMHNGYIWRILFFVIALVFVSFIFL